MFSIILSCWLRGNRERVLFFMKLDLMKFLNIMAWKFYPSSLARVYLPSTRHFTYSSALTDILRIVL